MSLTKASYSMINGAPLNVLDFGAVSGTDCTAAITAAITAGAALTSDGRAVRIHIPGGIYIISSTITVPNNIKIDGDGSLATIISSSVAGAAFKFDSSSNSGLTGMRIQFNSFTGNERAINILTSDGATPCLRNVFDDIEIASTLTSGQKGLVLTVSGTGIISEGQFSNFKFLDIDQPIFNFGGEGNRFLGFNISRFGVSVARSAIDCTGFVNYYEGRVAGTCFAGSVAYHEGGSRNIADIFSDITPTNGALNVTGNNNIVRLNRAEGAGIIGTYSSNTTVVDGQFTIANRTVTQGITPSASNFTLSGFGSTATVTLINGHDQRVLFTVNSSGTGQTANPTCTYLFAEGAWPVTYPLPQATRAGGNQLSVATVANSGSTAGWQITFVGTPVAGESYAFLVAC
jgi:hypothetical protein